MATPLYKSLKEKATSFYCFPSAAADISAAYMNSNIRMYFSNYTLLNLPKQNLNAANGPVRWDFDKLYKSSNSLPTSSYGEQIIESIRNYVANQEEVIKTSKLNNTDNYYNNNEISTTSEKVFWKWLKKLNVIEFELASSDDEYFANLQEFSSKNLNDDEYIREYLWRERKSTPYNISKVRETSVNGFTNTLEIEIDSITNLKVGDYIKVNGTQVLLLSGSTVKIEYIYVVGQKTNVVVSYTYTGSELVDTGTATLEYDNVVKYIGNVNGISNVSLSNRNYTEVNAHIPDHAGQTPDVLFRTIADMNYKPGMSFPILPIDYQPQIIGAEILSNPIITNPNNYPGSHYGQFDSDDYTYEVSTGDSQRRSGDYYGVYGDIHNTTFDDTNIDGLIIDFDSKHYKKMNMPSYEVSSFDEFNSLTFNNKPPKDFEYNAILWYYTLENVTTGKITTNLYGISFLDNPSNNDIEDDRDICFPRVKKLVATDYQDGTSYSYNLNLNYFVENDNVQDTYNPDAINSMFNMNLYQDALAKLAEVNVSFSNIIQDNLNIRNKISDLTQMIYTQTDINHVNSKINNLYELIKIYSTQQILDSDSISVESVIVNDVRMLKLNSNNPNFNEIKNISTKNLYNQTTYNPTDILFDNKGNILVNIINNDDLAIRLSNNNNLMVILYNDLDYKQTITFNVDSLSDATENKKLDIYINFRDQANNVVLTPLITNIDLPIYYNSSSSTQNYNFKNKTFNFNIDVNMPIEITNNGILKLALDASGDLIRNTISVGDVFNLTNFNIKHSNTHYNFDGQYKVDSIDNVDNNIYLDLSDNLDIFTFINTTFNSYPFEFNNSATYVLADKPRLILNHGFEIEITRILDGFNNDISSRYLINKKAKY